MKTDRVLLAIALTAGLLYQFAQPANADLAAAKAFGDHMVLQQQKPVAIWGTADAGASVTVEFAGQKAQAKADGEGHWRVTLKPLDASDTGRALKITAGDEAVTFNDVLVGEVWMLVGSPGGTVFIPPPPLPEHLRGKKIQKTEGLHTTHIQQADLPLIRLTQGDGNWAVVQPDNAGDQLASPFYFARELHRDLEVPVGMLTVRGSGPTYSWIPGATIEADEKLSETILKPYRSYVDQYPELVKAREAMNKKEQRTRAPKEWVAPDPASVGAPGHAYEQYVKPYVQFTVRGMTYEGSSGDIWGLPVARTLYDTLPGLVKGWREATGEADMPILLVGNNSESPRKYARPLMPAPSNIAQDAQRRTARQLDRVGLAVRSDFYVDVEQAHKNLRLGERKARAARAIAYGEDIVPTGPMYKAVKFQDGKAYIAFDNVDGGLAAGGSLVPQGGALKGFSIAGEDRVWYWAEAEIAGDNVVVHSEDVPDPVAVRFAFAEGAVPHLANEIGLPAPTFRTDDWSLDIPTPEPRTTKAPKVETAPKLDGEIKEGEWPAEPISSFVVRDTYRPANHATRVWLAYDAQNLYVAAEAEMAASFPIAGVKQDDNRMIVYDDAVEVLLDVNHDQTTYHRFVVNARGKLLDGVGYNGSKQGIDYFIQTNLPNLRWFDESWNADAKLKTGFGDNLWSFEMAIPWSAFGVESPEAGRKMGLQLIRTAAESQYVTKPFNVTNASTIDQRFNALMRNEWSQWTNTGRGTQTGATLAFDRHIHRPTRFGTLTLD